MGKKSNLIFLKIVKSVEKLLQSRNCIFLKLTGSTSVYFHIFTEAKKAHTRNYSFRLAFSVITVWALLILRTTLREVYNAVKAHCPFTKTSKMTMK